MTDKDQVTTDEVTEESSDEQKTYDAEYVKSLREEAKSYRKDKAALKKEFEDTRKKLEALEAEKLTDTEKKEKRIKELEGELEKIQGLIKQKEVDNLVLKAVSGKNIVDIETATLLIQKELASEEEVTSDTVSKVVDKVIKEKPFLVNASGANPSDGNFAKTKNEPTKDPDEMFGDFLRDI